MRSEISRKDFLKIIAASCGSAIVSACAGATATVVPGVPSVPARAVSNPTEVLPLPRAPLPPALTPAAPEFVTIVGDQFYFRGARFPINGFNYYPRAHPWRIFNIGEWEPRVTERELRLGVGLGANVVRTFIDFQYSLDNTKAQQPIENYYAPIARYVANVQEFLDLAGALDLKVIVTLLDSMDWSLYAPPSSWIVEEYLKALVPIFANDPRILCWDLQNEPDKAIRQVGERVVIPFFKRIAALVRHLDPNHLQTIGWIDRERAKYFSDFDASVDFWCFHFYDTTDRLNGLAQFYKSKTSKPVLLEEFGLATGGPGPDGAHTEPEQAAHFAKIFSILDDNKMCGSAFWALTDFPIGLAGNPPLNADSPENHYGVFRLDYSEKPVSAAIRSAWNNKAVLFNARRDKTLEK